MKIRFYLPSLLLCLLFIGCSDDSDNESVMLKIKNTDVNITAAGGTGTIEVSAPGTVLVSSSDEWCTVSVSGNVITVSASENIERVNRTAMITISYKGEKLSVPVTQKCAFLILESSSLIWPAQGGSQVFTVNSSLAYSITIEDDWLTYTKEEDHIVFTAEANRDNTIRTTSVIINSGTINEEISVTQEKAVLSVDQTNLFVSGEGGNNMVTVTSSFDFDVTVEDDWVSYSVEGDVVTIIAEKNSENSSRTTSVTLTSGDLSVAVLVTQRLSLTGEWVMNYTDSSGENQQSIVTLSDNSDGSYIMNGLPGNYSIVVTSNNNGDLIIINSQYMGLFSGYYLYLCITDGSSYTWDQNVQYKATYTDGNSFTFADNGTWTSHTVKGLLFFLFSSSTPSGSTGLGYIVVMDDIVLTRD